LRAPGAGTHARAPDNRAPEDSVLESFHGMHQPGLPTFVHRVELRAARTVGSIGAFPALEQRTIEVRPPPTTEETFRQSTFADRVVNLPVAIPLGGAAGFLHVIMSTGGVFEWSGFYTIGLAGARIELGGAAGGAVSAESAAPAPGGPAPPAPPAKPKGRKPKPPKLTNIERREARRAARGK